jgi:hypothetical protein
MWSAKLLLVRRKNPGIRTAKYGPENFLPANVPAIKRAER